MRRTRGSGGSSTGRLRTRFGRRSWRVGSGSPRDAGCGVRGDGVVDGRGHVGGVAAGGVVGVRRPSWFGEPDPAPGSGARPRPFVAEIEPATAELGVVPVTPVVPEPVPSSPVYRS